MPSDFINYTFSKLIEDFRKIVQTGVAGIINEMIESRFREIEDIRRRIAEIERILSDMKESGRYRTAESAEKTPEDKRQIEKCMYEGCEKTAFSRGYCKNHYYQLKRKGLLKNIEGKREKKRCSVDGCGNTAISKGLCKNHYYQYKRGTLVLEGGRYIKKEL